MVSQQSVETRLEQHRAEMTAHCYRMLGSAFEAEDAVQDTLVRAWRNLDRLDDPGRLRPWLYRIATNVCMDMLTGRERRARPMDLGPIGGPEGPLAPPLPEITWISPVPDARVIPTDGDPAELVAARENVRLAFVAALQHLPPRQRAILLLRDVVSLGAADVAALLDTSVASVNSALQRARATLAEKHVATDVLGPVSAGQRALLDRYVRAFEAYDLDAFLALVHEDATLSMPPYSLWMRGHEHIRAWLTGPGAPCRGSRLLPTIANGSPAFGQYRPTPGGGHHAWGLQILEMRDGRIASFNTFLDTAALFPLFGLPLAL